METKRRNRIIECLNEKYAFLINNFNMKEAYSKIVTWKPYKALSCFVYDWSYAPLKRREAQDALQLEPKKLIKNKADTDRISATSLSEEEEREFSEKSHRSYITNLKLARKTAVKKNKSVEVLWRGYRCCVDPIDQDFSVKELRRRLIVALRKIRAFKALPKREEKVSSIILYHKIQKSSRILALILFIANFRNAM